jgi:hypothetical protein
LDDEPATKSRSIRTMSGIVEYQTGLSTVLTSNLVRPIEYPDGSVKYSLKAFLDDEPLKELQGVLQRLIEEHASIWGKEYISCLKVDAFKTYTLAGTNKRKPEVVNRDGKPMVLVTEPATGAIVRLNLLLRCYDFEGADGNSVRGIQGQLLGVQLVERTPPFEPLHRLDDEVWSEYDEP